MSPVSLMKRILDRANSGKPIHVWLERNYAAISAAISLSGSKPPWKAMAAVAAENGVTTKDGNPPTSAAVRSAWRTLDTKRPAILAAKAAASERRRRNRAKSLVAPLVQEVAPFSAAPSVPAPLPDEWLERPRTKFVSSGGAKLKSRLPLSERETDV